MKKLLCLIVGLLIAGPAWAQTSDKGQVDHLATGDLPTCTIGHNLGVRAYDTTLDVEVTCNGTSWVNSGGVGGYDETIYLNADILWVDAAQCTKNTGTQFGGGPTTLTTIDCADNDAGRIGGYYVMPDNWDGGTFTMELDLIMANANPDGFYGGNVVAQCRGDSEAVNNTWGTAALLADLSGAVTVQWDVFNVVSGPVTPNCTTSCQVGDTCFFQFQALAASITNTNPTDVHIPAIQINYGVTGLDKVDDL